jgi:type II secretory pathway component PulK
MRQPELKFKRARGFLLIVAILVLVVIAVAIAAMGNMISADVRSSSGHAQSEQAYFAATSGVSTRRVCS